MTSQIVSQDRDAQTRDVGEMLALLTRQQKNEIFTLIVLIKEKDPRIESMMDLTTEEFHYEAHVLARDIIASGGSPRMNEAVAQTCPPAN